MPQTSEYHDAKAKERAKRFDREMDWDNDLKYVRNGHDSVRPARQRAVRQAVAEYFSDPLKPETSE